MNIRKLYLLVLFCILSSLPAVAQGQQATTQKTGNATTPRKKPSAWIIADVTGRVDSVSMDTLTYNFQRRVVPSLYSDALATTGNQGAPSQNQLWFSRPSFSEFYFQDALLPYLKTQGNTKFFNTYIPITQVSYTFGGSSNNNQDRLSAKFAGNVDRRLGFGASIDYPYSKGCYEDQATKDFTFGFTGYYKGDRYEAQAFFNQWNMVNKENGGIVNELYITDPAVLQGGVDKIEAKAIPVNLNDAHTRLHGKEFFLNHEFKFGYWQEEEVNDTLSREIYIPVVKVFHTLDYKENMHLFIDTNSSDQNFWDNHYLNTGKSKDETSMWRVANTVGVQLIEGFKPWVKFNLTAYATYEYRKYTFMPYSPSTSDDGTLAESITPLPEGVVLLPFSKQNLAWVGGRLAKDKGNFNYEAAARFGVLGGISGDILITGGLRSRFKLFGDMVKISANGTFASTTTPTLIRRYVSNNFIWDNKFVKVNQIKAQGQLLIPWTRTTIKAGFENIQNLVFFNTSGCPQQYDGHVQILSLALEQKLKLGIWNWDNSITYQASTNQTVLPLPALTIYSNMYLGFKAFHVLDLQIGVDCDYYTRYRGVKYQPATMGFCVGEDWGIGNYPFCNAYVTAKLYKTRFFVMMSHVNQGLFGSNYFSMPLYPLNPRRFQLGLSVDFTN